MLFSFLLAKLQFITLTSWLILASLAVEALFIRANHQSRFLAAGVALILLATPLSDDLLYFKYQNGNRDNWRAAFEFIEKNRKPDEMVVVSDSKIGEYYLQESVVNFYDFEPTEITQSQQRAWFVEDMTVKEIHGESLTWVHQSTQQVAEFDVNVQARNFRMRVHLYDPRAVVVKP